LWGGREKKLINTERSKASDTDRTTLMDGRPVLGGGKTGVLGTIKKRREVNYYECKRG